MISTVLAMLMMAPPPADTVARARKEYSACLSGFTKKSMKEDADEAAFSAGVGPACSVQEQKFRSAVIAFDTASGIKAAAAAEGADLEIEDMRANQLETFKDYRNSGSQPKS